MVSIWHTTADLNRLTLRILRSWSSGQLLARFVDKENIPRVNSSFFQSKDFPETKWVSFTRPPPPPFLTLQFLQCVHTRKLQSNIVESFFFQNVLIFEKLALRGQFVIKPKNQKTTHYSNEKLIPPDEISMKTP